MTSYSISTPVVLCRIVALVSPDRVRMPPAVDRLSLVDRAGHLADSESNFLERIRSVIEPGEPSFERIDVDGRARELRFSEGLPEVSWSRESVAPMRRVSVDRHVAFMVGHDHLEQSSAYLNGGR